MNFIHSSRRWRFVPVIDRMIVADLAKTLTAVLSIIVLIIVSRRSLNILGKAIEGAISTETIVNIIGLKSVVAAITFLPAGFFLAVLMVLGRMYRDNEIAALAVAGVGTSRLYRAIALFAVPLFVAAAGLALFLTPWCEARIEKIYQLDQQEADLRVLAAGRFSEYSRGDIVVYVEEIARNGQMERVFVQKRNGERLSIITSSRGQIEDLPHGRFVVLEDGEQVEGRPGEQNFAITGFARYGVRIEDRQAEMIVYGREAVSSAALLESDNPKDIVELQDRISVPLGVLILGMLAVPLAQVAPRGGIYGNVGAAFLIYVIYGNLQRIVHSWVIKGIAPAWLGYTGVYVLMLVLTLCLLARALGREWVLRVVTLRGVQ